MNAYRGSDYWVGYLSHSIALAHGPRHSTEDVLKPALKEFLRERPAGDELASRIRQTLKEKP